MIRLLGVVAAALVFAVSAAVAGPPNQADLEAEIVCPTCKTSLDQSSSPIATRMKSFFRVQIAAGASAAEIKAQLVDQFGPAVLAEPPKRGFDLLAWLLPIGALAVGAAVVAVLAFTWSRRHGEVDGREPESVDPDLERRLDDELDRFEA